MVRLEPMSPRDWEAWRVASVRSYAAEMASRGQWRPEDAPARGEVLFRQLVPDGQATRGQHFRHVVLGDGTVVGAVWLGAEAAPGPAYLWDIAIDAAHRGLGYGRAALAAAEALAAELGCGQLKLHVFGDNEVARQLYRSAGFVETDVSMEKPLVPPAGHSPSATEA